MRSRALTLKEQAFFTAQGFKDGWVRLYDEHDVIDWLYTRFNPTQFENFCVSILKTHCNVDIRITEKRTFSGADGGFDGEGTFEIEGIVQPVAMQAKRYNPESMVGSDHFDRFFGALVRKQIKHAFMMTTATFSKEAQEYAADYRKQGYHIEMIDQARLLEIMIKKTYEPHGFGLHKTAYKLVYFNEDVLLKAASLAL